MPFLGCHTGICFSLAVDVLIHSISRTVLFLSNCLPPFVGIHSYYALHSTILVLKYTISYPILSLKTPYLKIPLAGGGAKWCLFNHSLCRWTDVLGIVTGV